MYLKCIKLYRIESKFPYPNSKKLLMYQKLGWPKG
jgi:hypothetical protein